MDEKQIIEELQAMPSNTVTDTDDIPSQFPGDLSIEAEWEAHNGNC